MVDWHIRTLPILGIVLGAIPKLASHNIAHRRLAVDITIMQHELGFCAYLADVGAGVQTTLPFTPQDPRCRDQCRGGANNQAEKSSSPIADRKSKHGNKKYAR
jgi:hypothetical protein